MRCNNCGWDNDPGVMACVKCGHTLQNGNMASQDPYQNVNVPNAQNNEPQSRPTVINTRQAEPAPRPTRIVNRADLQGGAPINATVAQGPQTCPQCGYPVVGDFTSCPNCGASVSPAPTTIQNATVVSAPQPTPKEKHIESSLYEIDENLKCEKCGAQVSLDFSFCPKCGERIHLPTVRAIKHKPTPAPEPPKPNCYLTLIPEEDEQTEATRNTYEGESVILNRENTEPNNRTITSKEQAELICENGQWFILNKSELNSTFLEAGRKLELQSGDVIVLGDRRFKFETE